MSQSSKSILDSLPTEEEKERKVINLQPCDIGDTAQPLSPKQSKQRKGRKVKQSRKKSQSNDSIRSKSNNSKRSKSNHSKSRVNNAEDDQIVENSEAPPKSILKSAVKSQNKSKKKTRSKKVHINDDESHIGSVTKSGRKQAKPSKRFSKANSRSKRNHELTIELEELKIRLKKELQEGLPLNPPPKELSETEICSYVQKLSNGLINSPSNSSFVVVQPFLELCKHIILTQKPFEEVAEECTEYITSLLTNHITDSEFLEKCLKSFSHQPILPYVAKHVDYGIKLSDKIDLDSDLKEIYDSHSYIFNELLYEADGRDGVEYFLHNMREDYSSTINLLTKLIILIPQVIVNSRNEKKYQKLKDEISQADIKRLENQFKMLAITTLNQTQKLSSFGNPQQSDKLSLKTREIIIDSINNSNLIDLEVYKEMILMKQRNAVEASKKHSKLTKFLKIESAKQNDIKVTLAQAMQTKYRNAVTNSLTDDLAGYIQGLKDLRPIIFDKPRNERKCIIISIMSELKTNADYDRNEVRDGSLFSFSML